MRLVCALLEALAGAAVPPKYVGYPAVHSESCSPAISANHPHACHRISSGYRHVVSPGMTRTFRRSGVSRQPENSPQCSRIGLAGFLFVSYPSVEDVGC